MRWNKTVPGTVSAAVNSLRPSDAIWWLISGSILAQVMAWCLTAPSHYLNQCSLTILRSPGIHSRVMFTWILKISTPKLYLEIYTFEITATSPRERVNSLWPSDVICRQGSRSTLAQVMACCLTAPSHYLNQYWLMISEVLWHSADKKFTENTSDIYHWNEFEIYKSETVV